MKGPRFEGDQEATIPGLNLNDAAKGSSQELPFSFVTALAVEIIVVPIVF